MVEHLARLASGVSGLDAILGGGFVEGASYIIEGRPGAGKTILSNQVAFAQIAAGRRVLYITLLAETHDRLFQSLSTLTFFDREKLGDGIKYVSVFQSLRDEGLDGVVTLLRKEIQRQAATLLVFDGLLNARERAETDLDVKTFVAEIQSQAAFVGCTVLFLTSTRTKDSSAEHTMVDGVIELCDDIAGVRSFRRLQVRKSRGSRSLGGYHQYEIGEDGIVAFPRLEAVLARTSVEDAPAALRMTSGVDGLDEAMGGGLPAGSITLVMGPPGSGKTSLGINFLSQASGEEPALHFGFYEPPSRLMLKAASLGLDMKDAVASEAIELVWHPLTENILDKLAHHLLEAVRRRGVKRLFIDGLGGFERAAIHPLRLVTFFAALTNELRALGVTTVATWELRDLSGAGMATPMPDISSVLDNLLLLNHVDTGAEVKRLISVLKVRDSAHSSRNHDLVFTDKGLAVVPDEIGGKLPHVAHPRGG
ncbi:ATPase domain-containing protein [Labrys monachus]|uniref:non-specific serine/threonine protein kinase n=1 Tax=Labrys monachus TaxID=217067 RepID=A0ABU0FM91_9HYPH|nr:ATPase domain-containing protein [Labrys monachus]MDQ0395725.1 circadian clock protein KaiC [Labrys monachus]